MQARIMLLLFCGLMSGCYKDIVRHENVVGHVYCQYRITFTSPGASMSVGQTVCIFCKNLQFGGGECDATAKFRTPDGKQYDVAATGPVTGCQSCPDDAMSEQRVFEVK